jgi:Domain of unknown function (DUF6378)
MTTTIEDANELLRAAVQIRREAQAAGKPHEEWYASQGETNLFQHVTKPRHIDASTEETQHVTLGYDAETIKASQDFVAAREEFERCSLQQESLPAEKLLLEALAVIRDRRPKYGGPLQHFRRTVGMINAAFADVLRRPLTESDWAIFMTLDKVARYCGPNKTADGPVDLAGYAACLAEVEAARTQ